MEKEGGRGGEGAVRRERRRMVLGDDGEGGSQGTAAHSWAGAARPAEGAGTLPLRLSHTFNLTKKLECMTQRKKGDSKGGKCKMQSRGDLLESGGLLGR